MEYHILSKEKINEFAFQQTPERIIQFQPDLVLDMTFSPKIFIINRRALRVVEPIVKHGVEWLDARVDCSPSQPSDDEMKVYECYRMLYIHQTYKLTDKEKQYGKLNWIDIESTEFDFKKLENIPLEERLIFKLEEDYGIVLIHQSVIDLLNQFAKDVWVRGS